MRTDSAKSLVITSPSLSQSHLSSFFSIVDCLSLRSSDNMDPVSALGFAAAVVQFVTVTSKILTSTVGLCNSPTGNSSEILSLDNVYSKLQTLSLNLGDASRKAYGAVDQEGPSNHLTAQPQWNFRKPLLAFHDGDLGGENPFPTLDDSYASLRSLLGSCASDCSKMISIVSKIKSASNSGSRWRCFRVALKTFWNQDEIAQIENGLMRLQRLVTLEMCKISK